MKLFEVEVWFLVFLSLSISFISGLASVEDQVDKTLERTVSDYIFGSKNEDNKIYLPTEIKLMIMEEFSIQELFEFVQIEDYEEYHHFATEIYNKRYGNLPVNVIPKKECENEIIVHQVKGIYFKNATMAIKFLKSFHSCIKTLIFDFFYYLSTYNDELTQIMKTVDEYCSSSVTKIEIRYLKRHTDRFFSEMYFPNVQEIKLRKPQLYDSRFGLNHTFSNVRRMACNDIHLPRSWIQQNFPNLTHWRVKIDEIYFPSWKVIKVVEQSHQLIGLGLEGVKSSLLRVIDERFANIIELGIQNPQYMFIHERERVSVHMNHIERLTIQGAINHEVFDFITFENLKELHWYGSEPELDTPALHNMSKLERASFYIGEVENTTETINGLLNFMGANENLLEVRLFDTMNDFQQELYTAFNSSGIEGLLQEFRTDSDEPGVFYTKNPDNTTAWDYSYEFLLEDDNEEDFDFM